MKSHFEDSLTVLDSIASTNPLVIELQADLKLFFESQINLINEEIKYHLCYYQNNLTMKQMF